MSTQTIRAEKYFTLEIENASYTIPDKSGFIKFSVKNSSISAVEGFVTGDLTVDGVASLPLSLSPADSISFLAEPGAELSGITVTAPAGVIMQIMGAQG